jgi:tellurite resistance protein TerC
VRGLGKDPASSGGSSRVHTDEPGRQYVPQGTGPAAEAISGETFETRQQALGVSPCCLVEWRELLQPGEMGLVIGFAVVVLAMLAIDLGVLHRRPHAVRPREAAIWTAIWVGLALLFSGWIYLRLGPHKSLEFLTGYLIEEALSIDNMFVFLVIFSYFSVPADLQHRVLFWGVVGAIILRGIFILVGAALLHAFEWIVFVFGAFLIFTGIKVMRETRTEVHPERNPILRLFRRCVPMVDGYRGGRFFVMENGRRMATPLLLVVLVVEMTDVVFAVDSIPAIFAVTRDPFIVLTSNIFAILGLRSLYFLLAGVIGKLRYLKVGLGLVLTFVGTKMLLADWYKIPVGVSLGVVAALLVGSAVASLLITSHDREPAVEDEVRDETPRSRPRPPTRHKASREPR